MRVPRSSTAGRERNLERQEENSSQCDLVNQADPNLWRRDPKWFIFDILKDSKTLGGKKGLLVTIITIKLSTSDLFNSNKETCYWGGSLTV